VGYVPPLQVHVPATIPDMLPMLPSKWQDSREGIFGSYGRKIG
jgi:hypothetical protein